MPAAAPTGASNGAAAGPAAPLSPAQERSGRHVSFQPAPVPAAPALGGMHNGRGEGSGIGSGRRGSGSGRGSPGGSGHAGHAEGIRFTQLREVLRKLNFTRCAPGRIAAGVLRLRS